MSRHDIRDLNLLYEAMQGPRPMVITGTVNRYAFNREVVGFIDTASTSRFSAESGIA